MKVALLFNRYVRDTYVVDQSLARLRGFADVSYVECDHRSSFSPLPAPSKKTRAWLQNVLDGVHAAVVCHGAPRLTAAVLKSNSTLNFVGEIEGDRFSPRVDMDAAAATGVTVVDTTHGSSYAVAEWALALILVSQRNAGVHFRRFAAGEPVGLTMADRETDRGYLDGELRERTVGLVGLGQIARELIALLRPFGVTVIAHDPFVDPGRADALDVDLAPLDAVLEASDIVVVLVPETAPTHHLLSDDELAMLRPGAVLVNVSRGTVVSPDALLRRLERQDLWVGLDVWEPDPCPPESLLRTHPNVFYTPHIAGVTLGARRRMFDLMVDELARHHQGVQPRWAIDQRTRAGRRPTP